MLCYTETSTSLTTLSQRVYTSSTSNTSSSALQLFVAACCAASQHTDAHYCQQQPTTGKTIITIALLAAKWGKLGTSEDKQRNRELAAAAAAAVAEHPYARKPVLLVVMASTLHNWRNEIRDWAHLDYELMSGGTVEGQVKKLKRGKLELLVASYNGFTAHIQKVRAYMCAFVYEHLFVSKHVGLSVQLLVLCRLHSVGVP
jgi:SNF2-related domain